MARNSYKARPRRGLGGFTLVELVVVIAVLAILAGVGAVAYNGYIEYAKKGQDRATVGEIENALELAVYADPGMIGYTDVFFTSDNGIVVPSDLNGKVTAALEDVFGKGALGGIVPSYENWADQSYSFDISKIRELLNGTNLSEMADLTAYIDAVSGGGSASFAGDVQELWDTVENMVNLAQTAKDSESAEGAAMLRQLGIDNYDVGHLLQKTMDQTNENKQTIIDCWSNGSDFPASNAFLATRVARNYAFASYAKKQNLTEQQKTNLDLFSSNVVLLATSNYFDERNYMTVFSSIATQYNTSGQARIDALAYTAMMGTSESIGKDSSGNPMTDQELINKFGEYTDSLSAVLGNPAILDYATDSTYDDGTTQPVSGNGIRIKVTKVDGKLAFDVYPDGANPKTSGGSGGSEESAACGLDHNGMSTTARINFTSTETETYTSTETIQLCSKNYSNFGSCVLTLMDPATGNSGVISLKDTSNPVNKKTVTIESSGAISYTKNTENDTITVSATGVGEGSITVTINSKTAIGGNTNEKTRTFTISVNVH